MITNFLSLISKEALTTFGLCILASLSVGIIMRFFVKPIFLGVDNYINGKYEDGSKIAGIYATIKAILYTGVAFVLTVIALSMLMKVCVFPCDNTPFLAWIYFVPMFALQIFFDKNMKRLANKIFGIDQPSGEDDEEEEKVEKPKKQKIYTEKVKYTFDADGNKVIVE